LGLVGYTDSAYADHVDCKSTTGFIFKMAGGPISWRSRKQSITATSSTEAEYVAVSTSAKEAIWLRKVLTDLHYYQPEVQRVLIYGDNLPAKKLTESTLHHSRTKHIAVPYHYVKEQVELGNVELNYIPTTRMPADGLTKPLTGLEFDNYVKLLGLNPAPISGDSTQSREVSELLAAPDDEDDTGAE
jgi:hypothetical protein